MTTNATLITLLVSLASEAATRAKLEEEFEAYTRAENLPSEGDAMELIHLATTTPTQRRWLSSFVHRWDAMEAAESLGGAR